MYKWYQVLIQDLDENVDENLNKDYWMRIFHGKLKRVKILKVIKGTLLPPLIRGRGSCNYGLTMFFKKGPQELYFSSLYLILLIVILEIKTKINYVKLGSNLVQKLTFPIFWAPAPTELQFSIFFFFFHSFHGKFSTFLELLQSSHETS